jgi:hypothetical protein
MSLAECKISISPPNRLTSDQCTSKLKAIHLGWFVAHIILDFKCGTH